MRIRSVRATACEREQPLPGDELITAPIGSITNAITIRGSRRLIWPWLAQMGAGRAGWYSYDVLDNGGAPSAAAIVPGLQNITAGTLFPALPGVTDGFVVLASERDWYLVLGWPAPHGGAPTVTWAFVLEELGPRCTRVIVRARGARGYRFHGLPGIIGLPLVRLVHFLMERKQLSSIARRVESACEGDRLLDRVMPVYDIVERHHRCVAAPASTTLAAAAHVDLQSSLVIRAIFKGRELFLGADPDEQKRPRALLALTRSLGWGMLAGIPDREVVMGAAAQPWKANVVFRTLAPDAFLAFNEPDYVKIVWTLRADPLGPHASEAVTETRVVATDEGARRKFRRYWRRFSPGIILIRWIALGLVKRDAERRACGYREVGSSTETMVPPLSGTSM